MTAKRTRTNGEVERKGIARMPIDLGPLVIQMQSYVDAAFAVENAALIAERDALLIEVGTLHFQIDGKDALIAQQIAEISAKNAEIEELEAARTHGMATIVQLNARIDALEQQIDVGNGQLLALEAQVAALQVQVGALDVMISDQNAYIATLQAQIADLQAQLAAATVFPVITSISDLTVNETTSSAVFTVTMDRTTTRAVNIDYTTVNGTAIAGQDYTATSGILVIVPGALSATVSVPILNDANVEGNEAFTLALSNARLSLAINDATGSGTIISEDVIQPPPPVGSIPLTFNDARFAGNVVSGPFTGSGTLANRTITQTGSTASISQTGGTLTIDTCRVGPPSREGVRVTSGVIIRNSYLECIGQGADHADTIQAYSPGQTGGIINVTDSSIVANTVSVTAGLFVADSWGGTVTMKNVMFKGGPYGCRIHADPGKTVNVSFGVDGALLVVFAVPGTPFR